MKNIIFSAVYRPFSGYGEDQSELYPFKSILKQGVEDFVCIYIFICILISDLCYIYILIISYE